MNNKKLKIIGNLLVVAAILLLVKKLCNYDIDYTLLITQKNMIIVTLMTLFYGVNVFICAFPWFNFVKIFEGMKLSFFEVASIYTKANLLKYIPGNVLQYIGRNELAIRSKIAHTKVAFATGCDIVSNLGAVFILVLIFSGDEIVNIAKSYDIKLVIAVAFLIIIILIVLFFVFLKKKSIITEDKLKEFINASILNIIFYIAINLFSSVLFIIILMEIAQEEVYSYGIVVGAFLLSWIVGFIIPGAPGGIGIREAMITFLLAGFVPEESIVVSILTYRLITTIGDLIGFFIAAMLQRVHEKSFFSKEENV